MMLRDLTLHATMTIRALARRRLAVVILVVLPIALYAASHEAVGRSVRVLVFGITWAVSTVAYFATTSARELEPRLRLAGRSSGFLATARIGALLTVTAGLALVFWAIVLLDQSVRSPAGVALDFAVSGVVAVTFGAAVGVVVAKEMEGTLVLFFFAALQAVVNPFGTVAKFLPFWSSRELGTYAVDGPEQGSLVNGLAHALLVIALCLGLSYLARRRAAGRPPLTGH